MTIPKAAPSQAKLKNNHHQASSLSKPKPKNPVRLEVFDSKVNPLDLDIEYIINYEKQRLKQGSQAIGIYEKENTMIDLSNRADKGLAFLLKFENVAWYQDGRVRILDRRVYPRKTTYLSCSNYHEVAQAIQDMVTQSEGPYIAGAMGMVLASQACKKAKTEASAIKILEDAAWTLSHARPTTTAQMGRIVGASCDQLKNLVRKGASSQDLAEAAFRFAYNYENTNYLRYDKIGWALAKKTPNQGGVLTQCFPGTVVGTFLRALKEEGKDIRLFCPETRPYFQGSRLTASVACDMGFDVKVISDNMPAYTLKSQDISLFTSASDVITMDGHVINKIGTFQIALAAHYFGVPYYVTGTPDPDHPDCSGIQIEERDPGDVLRVLGEKITMDGVEGWYPAFDITPPELVTGIITDRGTYPASDLAQYFSKRKKDEGSKIN